MEERFTSKAGNDIPKELIEFIHNIAEAVLIQNERFDKWKKWLAKYCNDYNVEYNYIETEINDFFEIFDEYIATHNKILKKALIKSANNLFFDNQQIETLIIAYQKVCKQQEQQKIEEENERKRIQDEKRKASEQQALKQKQQTEQKKRQSDWDTCKHINTIVAYKNFINSYKSGQFINEAKNRIKKLQQQKDQEKLKRKHTEQSNIRNKNDNSQNLASEYFKKGYNSNSPQEQIQNYEKSLNYNPNDADTLNNLGLAYNAVNNYEKAIECLKEAIRINPFYNSAIENLQIINHNYANYYHEKGYEAKSNEEKIKFYEKAISLNPDSEATCNNLGLAYAEIDNYEKAISLLKKSISLKPNDNIASDNLKTVYTNFASYYHNKAYNSKSIDEQILLYGKAFNLNSENAATCNNLGLAYYEKKNHNKAIYYLDKATNIDRNDATAYNNLGLVYSEIDNFDKAVSCFKKAIELNPKYTNAKENLKTTINNKAVEYHNKGYEAKNPDEKIKYYEQALYLNPEDVNTYNNLGLVYFEMGNIDNAIKYIEKAVSIDVDNTTAYYNLGILYGNKKSIFGNSSNKKQIEYFQKAAKKGHTEAQNWLKNNKYSW